MENYPVTMCFGGGGDNNAAEEARRAEEARQGRISQGMTQIEGAFSGFNEPYYQHKADAYNAFYQPQVNQQFNDTKDALSLQLSRNGIGASSAAANGYRKLGEDFAKQQADIQSKAQAYQNSARSDVQGLRNTVVQQLNSTSDSALAAQAANNAAFVQSNKPDTYDPITSLFADYAGKFKQDQSASQLAQALGQSYNTPLTSIRQKASRLVS